MKRWPRWKVVRCSNSTTRYCGNWACRATTALRQRQWIGSASHLAALRVTSRWRKAALAALSSLVGLGFVSRTYWCGQALPNASVPKGRFEWLMAGIPVKLITHPQPGLFGAAAAYAQEHTTVKPVETVMRTAPVIPVLVIEDVAHARPIAEALVAGGLPVLEVTLRTAAALDVIAEMKKVPGAIVGAGTVVDIPGP